MAKLLRTFIGSAFRVSALFQRHLRAEEIVAIEKAIEIISSGAVAGNADKHLPSLLQTTASAFPQLRAEMNLQAKARMVSYLNRRAKQLKSRVLSTLAVRASDDPFQKVKKERVFKR